VQPSFDQLAELAVLGRVVRIDPEQELPIVRVEKGLSAQGGRMWPDSQAPSQFIDVRPVKLPDVLIGDGQLTADDPGRTRPELVRRSPAVAPTGKVVVRPSSGCTESRLCCRVAPATYADTPKDATAMTTPQIAMTVFASTKTSQPGRQPDPGTSVLRDLSTR
jgi:hypothetical protein